MIPPLPPFIDPDTMPAPLPILCTAGRRGTSTAHNAPNIKRPQAGRARSAPTAPATTATAARETPPPAQRCKETAGRHGRRERPPQAVSYIILRNGSRRSATTDTTDARPPKPPSTRTQTTETAHQRRSRLVCLLASTAKSAPKAPSTAGRGRAPATRGRAEPLHHRQRTPPAPKAKRQATVKQAIKRYREPAPMGGKDTGNGNQKHGRQTGERRERGGRRAVTPGAACSPAPRSKNERGNGQKPAPNSKTTGRNHRKRTEERQTVKSALITNTNECTCRPEQNRDGGSLQVGTTFFRGKRP